MLNDMNPLSVRRLPKPQAWLALIALLAASPGKAQGTATSPTLPQLNVIQEVVLRPTYACDPAGDSTPGYGNTALFLSDYSRQRNSPELLFNGACGAEDYFDVNTAGDDMSLIADLGADLPVETLTAQQVFNLKGAFSFADYTTFAWVAKIVQGHTYAVVINHDDRRGLFVFSVVRFVPDLRVDIRFSVKDYQIELTSNRSPGFDWSSGATSQASATSVTFPNLNAIQGAALMPAYSCNPGNPGGYSATALFLSDYGRQHNSPVLLFNGACGSVDYFQVSLAGDSFSLVADLGGNVSIDTLTAQQVFNLTGVGSFAAYTRFPSVAVIVPGHTYAVVTNTNTQRGLLVFTVGKLVPDLEVDLQFAVKDYQVNLSYTQAPGFDWGAGAKQPFRILPGRAF